MYNRGRKEQYCVRPTSINATTMAEHSGGDFAVRAQVNIQKGFFPLCVLHCRYEYIEKRKGGNINYQVVKRREYSEYTRGCGKRRGKRVDDRVDGRSSDTRPRPFDTEFMMPVFRRRSASEIAKFRNTRKTVAKYIMAVLRTI